MIGPRAGRDDGGVNDGVLSGQLDVFGLDHSHIFRCCDGPG